MTTNSSYDKFPTIHVSDDASLCHSGWEAIVAEVRRGLDANARSVLAVECYPGTDTEEIRAGLHDLGASTVIFAEDALKSPEAIDALLKPWLGDDLVFSRMRSWEISLFFDPEKVQRMQAEIARASSLTVIYGTGAAFVAEQWQKLLYCDITRCEIQLRQRAHRVGSLGAGNAKASALALYKRGYFVDWRAGDLEKHRLHGNLDYYVDTNIPASPNVISGEYYRQSLIITANRPFRLVPFFDPGIWGGEWMRQHFDLPSDAPNFAWCFDCVPEENSLRFAFGDRIVQTPALSLVHEQAEPLLGREIVDCFGAEFPIRFDLLDTVGGGNLSLQVHPLRAYIAEHFGMPYTQDESYYMLDALPEAMVYLGLKKSSNRGQMAEDLALGQQGGPPFPAEAYVNAWPAKKHDHFSIPAGTIHCSGRNSMVLEISATPYIFTFKLWDWGRVGLDGLPRPIHLEHGIANIQWNRDTDWVQENLLNQAEIIAQGDGWYEERTGLHALEFIETRRHWFTQPVPHDTEGNLHVLNLVEGEEAIVESPAGAFPPLVVHYAETFIIPACVGPYRISPRTKTDRPLATVKAFVRGSTGSRFHNQPI